MKKKEQMEYQDRILYSMLLPATRLARILNIPLKQLGDWLQVAYFHELKKLDFKLHEIADHLAVSPRKAAMLSRRLKENFIDPERHAALPRRIEFMLWAGPLSRARIKQILPAADAEDVDSAVDQLLAESRILERKQARNVVYEVSQDNSRLVSGDWRARLDALDNLLGTVVKVVYERFFRSNSDAFARTITFRIHPDDTDTLAEIYDDVWTRINQLEERAKTVEDAMTVAISICWTPYDSEVAQ